MSSTDFAFSAALIHLSGSKRELASILVSIDSGTTEAIDALGRNVKVQLIRGDRKVRPSPPTRDGIIYTCCLPEQVASEMDRLVLMHGVHRPGRGARRGSGRMVALSLHTDSPVSGRQRFGRTGIGIGSLGTGRAIPFFVTRDYNAANIDSLEAANQGELGGLIET